MNRELRFSSSDALIELISTALETIRRSPLLDSSRPMILSTMNILKGHRRDDLCQRFITDLRSVVAEVPTVGEQDAVITTVTGDNLTEENMEIEGDDQEEKQKKTILASSKANDGQTAAVQDSQHGKQRRRKSRFSDILPSDRTDADDRARTRMSTIPINMVFSRAETERQRSSFTTVPSTTNGQRRTTVSGARTDADDR